MITAVISCMGRLSHLSITLGYALETFDRVVVVDWSCPENGGKFAESQGAKVIYKPGEKFFSGSKAKNLGAKHVTSEYIAFIDADTLCMPGLREDIDSLLSPTRMILSARNGDGSDVNDTVGFLVCPTESFWNVGGFDESWIGWGHEDTHLRGKLLLDAGLGVVRLSQGIKLGAIAHSNELRETFREAPIKQTAVEGWQRLVDWFKSKGVEDYPRGELVKDIVFNPHTELDCDRLRPD
jgi:hypothetical protein